MRVSEGQLGPLLTTMRRGAHPGPEIAPGTRNAAARPPRSTLGRIARVPESSGSLWDPLRDSWVILDFSGSIIFFLGFAQNAHGS